MKTYVSLVGGEAMIDARREHDQIILLQFDPQPLVGLAAHVEEASTIEDVSDLLVLVQVLAEEDPQLGLVRVLAAHGRRRDGDLIAVQIAALRRERVHLRKRRTVVVADTQRFQLRRGDAPGRLVREALVALCSSWVSTPYIESYRAVVDALGCGL